MINRLFLRILFAFLPLFLFTGSSWSQDINYQNIFGDNWKKAASFEKENRNWIEARVSQNHIPYKVAMAVVFPELVRYSALRDKMEITLLKTLYINLGETYANFSIGQFQMKPSFAEMIREKAPAVMGRRSKIIFKNRSEYDDIKDFRQSIVSDLEDPEIQLKYLIVFMKICEKTYRINRKDEAFRIKFLATAYNYGFNKSIDQIENMMDKKYFNTALFRTDNYCYSEVSLFWYNHYIPEK